MTEKPWELEPTTQYYTEDGFKCLIRKHPEFQTLCGYVRVMRTHPLYGKHHKAERMIEVHGGVTFGEIGHGRRYMKRGFWIGFDCTHYMDFNPGLRDYFPMHESEGQYRDSEYVRAEITGMIHQLKRIKK